MPRSLQEILEHADELSRRFEEHEPKDVRDAAPLHAIGTMLGTSGEAARKRYSGQHAKSA